MGAQGSIVGRSGGPTKVKCTKCYRRFDSEAEMREHLVARHDFSSFVEEVEHRSEEQTRLDEKEQDERKPKVNKGKSLGYCIIIH
jgi:hypothetical protein